MRNKYLQNRKNLISEAESLLKEGKIEEANARMEEIKALDDNFEKVSKAQANINALKNQNTVNILQDESLDNKNLNILESTITDEMKNKKEEEKEYVNAWAKHMMNKPLNENELKVFNKVNDNFKINNAKNEGFTHTTKNTGVVIPETVVAGIWREIEDTFPLWADVAKLSVKGNLTLLKGESSTEAKWYEESDETEDGKEVFGTLNLSGCELSRSITVSWKLNTMSIDDFIPYIQSKLAERMGAALGYGVAIGKGKPGAEDNFKPEPRGIITALKEGSKEQVVEYTELEYETITEAFSKLKSGYASGASVYATNKTIWTQLANLTDKTGKPYFIPDTVEGGVGRLFGTIVKEDDSIPEGDILIGNANKGYLANINQSIILDQEDHKKARKTDHIAYAVVDGDVVTEKAFALITKSDTGK